MLVESALAYARTLIGLPYRWYRAGEAITGDDKFYAADGPAPVAADLRAADKCIVCTGVANLMRRHVGLPVPPADADAGYPFPGTTDTWFRYLEERGKLKPFVLTVALEGGYTAGSLLLRNFGNITTDQGHVAVLIDNTHILHAYAIYDYDESEQKEIKNVGECNITDLEYSHSYAEGGYYTHICEAADWLGS